MKFEAKLTIGLILAAAIELAGVLMWAGATEERLYALEMATAARTADAERLARVEAEIAAIRRQLDRIESRLERKND